MLAQELLNDRCFSECLFACLRWPFRIDAQVAGLYVNEGTSFRRLHQNTAGIAHHQIVIIGSIGLNSVKS